MKQWLDTWDAAEWAPDEGLPEPPREFYVGSISIRMLRELAGVSRRQISERKSASDTPGYQRAHEVERSNKIARYISYGYPLSTSAGLRPEDHADLIHPGWLPSSIIVNIISPGEKRRRAGKSVKLAENDAISVQSKAGLSYLEIPEVGSSGLEPLEIIDGQHRIFSVDSLDDVDENYEVPVVFFNGLTQAWQAYLFWVINVEPKKINPSLAFDLYPELRSQSWLERGEGIKIYQEHRAQEITEALWRSESSVWRDRIELFGGRVEGHVSNAAFIRTLMATFVRRWGADHRIGGLFGSVDREGKERVLRWNRAQQIAFLITIWNEVAIAVKTSRDAWAIACRDSYGGLSVEQKRKINPHDLDAAFAGPYTLLGTDQGVRAVCYVFNAFFQASYSEVGLEEWESDNEAGNATSDVDVEACIKSLRSQKSIFSFVSSLASSLVQSGFDWRTSAEPGLKMGSQESALRQASYRGSSGYKLLQDNLIRHLKSAKNNLVRNSANDVAEMVGVK
ncbi:DGQHR domain-containing protein [Luteimonas sp. A1P009]|uniref:DGQHR domain-containing protein n=1 Tax=Luteimonas fraxinea TaxID=2901869 RepID=A0ABS8UDI5_9GAMM|nr:DGQHR domain-containing protein [Luteimonas fraxinea]